MDFNQEILMDESIITSAVTVSFWNFIVMFSVITLVFYIGRLFKLLYKYVALCRKYECWIIKDYIVNEGNTTSYSPKLTVRRRVIENLLNGKVLAEISYTKPLYRARMKDRFRKVMINVKYAIKGFLPKKFTEPSVVKPFATLKRI